jgi:diguanylate cyclase (GGDEF)-like protein
LRKTLAARPAVSTALRAARRAWTYLHLDSRRAVELADRALALAVATGDVDDEGWAHLVRGFSRLYFATPAEAAVELRHAQACFEDAHDAAGRLLASALIARSMWRAGRFRESVEHVLPLRDEGLRVLKNDQRGVLLNTIAGCYSALGDSAQAFAYMYQALRDAGPRRGHGFDVVLHCNLSHELLQIGDYEEALRHVDRGLARAQVLDNPRLVSVLRINRVICLTELDRADEALPEVAQVSELPADATGRGPMALHFETLAIAALHAGENELGAELVARAHAAPGSRLPDERVETAVADALLAGRGERLPEALRLLGEALPVADDDHVDGLSLRVRARFFLTLADLHEQSRNADAALAALRRWQHLHLGQAKLASRARYQAAALQTEVVRLQQQLDENDAKRRATERARADLATINEQLSRKIAEVESLQQALQHQVTQDSLTGLFNRRHLNEALPAMFALARRDRQPLAVVVIDLDHFKSINDRFGHDAGDRLLAAFGRLLVGNSRDSDVCCRYGGEEFCLLMARTGAQAARQKVNALLRLWRSEVFAFGATTLSRLSFSAGVSDSLCVSDAPEALLKSADDALLAAKRQGRDRVLAVAAPATEPPRERRRPRRSSLGRG